MVRRGCPLLFSLKKDKALEQRSPDPRGKPGELSGHTCSLSCLAALLAAQLADSWLKTGCTACCRARWPKRCADPRSAVGEDRLSSSFFRVGQSVVSERSSWGCGRNYGCTAFQLFQPPSLSGCSAATRVKAVPFRVYYTCEHLPFQDYASESVFFSCCRLKMEGEKKSESDRELEKMDRSWSRAKSRDSSSPILCSIQFSESQRNISFL